MEVMTRSTFSLILPSINISHKSTEIIQFRITEALKFGAIPVIFGDDLVLPFSEIFDWGNAAIIIPVSLIQDINLILKKYTVNTIMSMQHAGKLLYQAFSDYTYTLSLILTVLKHRLGFPPLIVDEKSNNVVIDKKQGKNINISRLFSTNNFELLEQKMNLFGNPLMSHLNTPLENINPKKKGKETGYNNVTHPSRDRSYEQFTIVILVYDRIDTMLENVASLKGLQFLSKVIIIWNNPIYSSTLTWPEIGVQIHLIRPSRNSLNNRFLPYDIIQTDAILSLDDDCIMKHDDILLAFRVWKIERERIVGCPGRVHKWDAVRNEWNYSWQYSDLWKVSMVLTGAAFFHKYYAYVYSYVMQSAIREFVDENLNCEDIAMNFLVSHITQKPPIQVICVHVCFIGCMYVATIQ
ncbi:exostosin-like 3 [Mytilus edulis]|uniref:exostosin-like 3 n=1 Tax=Mytilus edulis TaxID=6550 RepID=UPI0039EF302F